MSIEYPCVYWSDGMCKKFSDDKVTSFCVEGPCGDQMQSNADRIRAMSDEDFAAILRVFCIEMADCIDCPLYRFGCPKSSAFNDWIKWLQQPLEEVDHEDRIG